MISSAHGTGRDARNRHGSSELYRVADGSRGSAGSTVASAASSAWSCGSCSRENPVASTGPSRPTSTAPTQYADGDGGHRRDSPMASPQPVPVGRVQLAIRARAPGSARHGSARSRSM